MMNLRSRPDSDTSVQVSPAETCQPRDPTFDGCFKSIFGNERNDGIIRNFIESYTNITMETVRILNPIQGKAVKASKEGIVDVLCTDNAGIRYLVEMQRSYRKDFCDRLMYYGSFCIYEQLNEGDQSFGRINKVIVIAILASTAAEFKSNDRWLTHHQILEKDSHVQYFKKLEFIVLDLPKFNLQTLSELNSSKEAWAFFFKYLRHINDTSVIDALGEEYPLIGNAIDKVFNYECSKEEYRHFILNVMDPGCVDPSEEWQRAKQEVRSEVAREFEVKLEEEKKRAEEEKKRAEEEKKRAEEEKKRAEEEKKRAKRAEEEKKRAEEEKKRAEEENKRLKRKTEELEQTIAKLKKL